jgi:hypothetical protein
VSRREDLERFGPKVEGVDEAAPSLGLGRGVRYRPRVVRCWDRFVGVVKIPREARVIYNDDGVPTLHGRGLGDVKRRIMEAFDAMREGSSRKEVLEMLESSNINSVEETAARFHRRVEKLSRAALASSHIMSEGARKDGVWEITVPDKTAETLFREALDLSEQRNK